MKKTRILSMLLAVVLVLTSLPTVAISVAAAELEAMETRESITIPTDSDIGWTGVTYVKDKYATFNLPGGGQGFAKVKLYTVASGDTDICKLGQTYTVTIDIKVSEGFTGSKRPGISAGISALSWELYNGLATDEWYHLTKTLSIPASNNKDIELHIYYNPAIQDRVKFDIRNITITDSTGNIVLNYGEATDNWSFPVRKDGDFIGVTDNSGLSADLTSANTTASYDIADTKLLPGVYQLTGAFTTDAGEASLGVKLGDTAMTVGATANTSATVGTDTDPVTYTITVAEETTLSDINFEWAKDESSEATKLMLGSLKFTCVELTTASRNANIKRGTVVANGDSIAFWSSDTGAVSVDGSRNYVQCNVIGGGNSFILVDLYDPANTEGNICEAGTYALYVNARRSEAHSYEKAIMHMDVLGTNKTKHIDLTTDWPVDAKMYDFTVPSSPTSKIQLKFWVNPSTCTGSQRASFDFRGIKIVNLTTQEVVYALGEYDESLAPDEWTFCSDGTVIKTPGDEIHHTDLSELMLDPAAGGSTFTYNAASKDITLTPGEYTVSASAYSAGATQTATLTATAANGETATGTAYDVSADGTTGSMILKVTSTTKLSSVGITLGDGSHVYLNDITIKLNGREYVAPNAGIMMALLLKKTGSSVGFKKTNFLEKIYEDVGGENWTYPEGRTLKAVIGESIKYLSMQDIQINMDTFAYSYDYELEPGTYNLTGIIRTTVKGQTSRSRIAIGKTNVADVSYGNEWVKINVTFDLNDSTDFQFRVYGGPWEGYIQSYEIANLALVDVNETPEYKHILPWEEGTVTPEEPEEPEVVEPEEPEEEVILSAVEGSLAPDVYNDVGSDKWDLGLEKYAQTLSVKSKDGNLYLAMRNVAARTDEGSGFTYNTGITLEPGTYTLECDIRTAVKDDVAMVRTFVNGAVLKLDWIGSEWTTFDSTFVVTEATELVIHFAGGTDVNFIKDFDVSAVKVVKQ